MSEWAHTPSGIMGPLDLQQPDVLFDQDFSCSFNSFVVVLVSFYYDFTGILTCAAMGDIQ